MFFWKKTNNNPKPNQNIKPQEPRLLAAANLAFESNIGIGREKNEDFCAAGVNKFHNQILIVCDGLGGYQGGQEASNIVGKMIISAFLEQDFNPLNPEQIKSWFVNTINQAKWRISEFIAKNPHCYKMATTLACYIVTAQNIFGFNMGDSRLYAITDQKLIQISHDQNFLNYLLDKKVNPNKIQAYGAQMYSIVNYIGQFDETELKYDFYHYPKPYQFNWILITSDGIHNFVTSQELLQPFYQEQGLFKIAHTIIKQALSNQSNDNLSIAIAAV